jgi:hypothetical protein
VGGDAMLGHALRLLDAARAAIEHALLLTGYVWVPAVTYVVFRAAWWMIDRRYE